MSEHSPEPGASPTVDPAQKNIGSISQLERDALENRSLAEKISDVSTKAAGSVTSMALHAGVFLLWVLINTGVLPLTAPFDPFPFGILTLGVSTEGVLLAIMILISQNHMTRQADRRAHLDLQINLLAEQELTLVLQQLRRIAHQLGLPPDELDKETELLLEKTEVARVMSHLEEQLPKE